MLSKVICALVVVSTVRGSIQHGEEAAHHVAPIAVKATTTLVKEAAPIAIHDDQAHYDHGHGHDDAHGHNCYQKYKFGYKILDKYGNKQAREEEADEYNNRKGYYSFIDHDGLHRKVEYVADKYGFRATVITNEPGTAKQHPADVNMLANPLKIAHHVKSHAAVVGHHAEAAYGEDYAQAELDPRGAPVIAAAPLPAAAPLLKEAAVIAPVAIAKQAVLSAPIAHVSAAPVGIVHAAAVPAPIVKSSYAPVQYTHSAAPVIALPKLATISRGHAYDSGNHVGHGHVSHYAPIAQHAPSYAPIASSHNAPAYFVANAGGHGSHQGLIHQASYARPVAYAIPYGVHRMAFVTGGYRSRRHH